MKRIAAALAVLILAGCSSPEQKAAHQAERARISLQVDARLAVEDRLSDPESARFEYLSFGSNLVCGRVNAKNTFGGYGGFRRFIYVPGATMLEGEDLFDKAWQKACPTA